MEKQTPYEDFIKEWHIDGAHATATHHTGFTASFTSARNGQIKYSLENYLPWRRALHQKGMSHQQIDAFSSRLVQEFQEICRRNFLTPQRIVSFKGQCRETNFFIKGLNFIKKVLTRH